MLRKPMTQKDKTVLLEELKTTYSVADIKQSSHRSALKYLLPNGEFLCGGFHSDVLQSKVFERFMMEHRDNVAGGREYLGEMLAHATQSMTILPDKTGQKCQLIMCSPPNDKQAHALFALSKTTQLHLTTYDKARNATTLPEFDDKAALKKELLQHGRARMLDTPAGGALTLQCDELKSVKALKEACDGLFPERAKGR